MNHPQSGSISVLHPSVELTAKSGRSMSEGASVNSSLILGMAYRTESTALVSSSPSAQGMRRVKQIKQA